MIETVGDAIDFFAKLSPAQRDRHHWQRAILMLNQATKRAQYLMAATINFQTALAMDLPLNE